MERKILVVVECSALGDIISSTPAIRMLATEVYKSPVNIATYLPEFYNDLPYVNEIFHISETLKDYHVVRTFNVDKIKKSELSHEKIDIRQFHSLCCGFMLLPNQMTCDYISNPYESINDLPEKYVVIHPAKTWDSRTWSSESWQELANGLNDAGISVVSIGKTDNKAPDVSKPIFKINNVFDLTDQLSLSQCWHVLDKAEVVITMDSGILHLAGTTDVHILQLGSSIHPYYRAPYRNGTQQYKYTYVKGDCNLFCASSMNYVLREDIPFKISKCAEQYETFECHPPTQKVLNKVLTIYN